MPVFQNPGLVVAMTLLWFSGGLAFRNFEQTKDVLWLLSGLSLYGLAIVAFIHLIGQSGLARAVIYSSAVGVALNVGAGIYFREGLGWRDFTAAALVCIALLLPLLSPSAPTGKSNSENSKTNQGEQS